MKELKIKAWDKKKKVWLVGAFSMFDGSHYFPFGFKIDYSFSTENVVLVQSTGLKDKNGKEIYEGDITTEGVVGYHTDLNWDSGGSYHPGFYFKGGEMDHNVGFDVDIEIIGNIYENKDLLS